MSSRGTAAVISTLVVTSLLGGCLDAEPSDSEAVGSQAQAISTEGHAQYAVILIDRTGSMTIRRANTHTRCNDAVVQAAVDAEDFFRNKSGLGVAIWQFSSTIGVQQVGNGYYTNMSQVNAALNTIPREGCLIGANTPLADAMCKVMMTGDADNTAPLFPKPGGLYVETDAFENASVGPCSGPSGDLSMTSSWQRKVLLATIDNNATVHTRFWLSSSQILQLGSSIDVETGKPTPPIATNATCSSQAACESDLFEALAFWTAGTYGLVRDSDMAYTCTYGSCPAPVAPQ